MTANTAKVTILFIQPQLKDMPWLATLQELRNLRDGLLREAKRDALDWQDLPAARVSDLAWGMRTYKPQIVHYAGHGDWNGELYFDADDNKPYSVKLAAENFAETLRAYQDDPQTPRIGLVVLAACHTAQTAQLVARHTSCAIGMSGSVDDIALARFFTPNFYAALADGRSVQNALDSAVAELRNHGYAEDADMVHVFAGDGVDPAKLVLTRPVRFDQGAATRRLAYLRSLLGDDCSWAKVSMSLFGGQDARLARNISLLDIFTPLPVDFVLTLEVAGQGQVKDWWCGNLREDPGREVEREWYELAWDEQSPQALPEARGRRKLRQQAWVDLGVGAPKLKSLLDLAQQWAAGQRPGQSRDKTTLRWQADASHAALVQSRFVLIGDPGSGKSTFLRHLALCLAGQLLHDAGQDGVPPAARLSALPGWTRAYTPIYIELRALVDAFPPVSDGCGTAAALPGLAELRSHLRSYLPLQPQDGDLIDDLFALLRQGRAALLLDGLDEVSQASAPERQAQIQAFVNALVEEFEQAPIIVTARPYAYDQQEWMIQGFGHTRLAPLGAERQAEFARRLFEKLLHNDRTRYAWSETAAFVAALTRIPNDLRSNPLLLTLLAALWLRRKAAERDLPSTRGELYRRAVDLLVKDWVARKHTGYKLPLGEKDLRIVLEQVAFDAQERRRTKDEPALIMEGDIYRALRRIGQGQVADNLLDHLAQQAGMLLEQAPAVLLNTYDKQYKFLHLSFQEYLAACELLYRPQDERPAGLPLLPARRFPDGLANYMLTEPLLWANVLRLAVDELITRKRTDDAGKLLARCCESYRSQSGASGQVALLPLELALDAELFHKTALLDPHDTQVLHEVAVQALVDQGEGRFTPKQRDVAGKLLGSDPFPGHDPRPGVGLRPDGLPDLAWVEIPDAGEFIYQNAERRSEPIFWIAKYPITYAQFQAFVSAADGFRNPVWWEQPTRLAAPDGHRAAPGEQWFKYWNHPRERVSWYDAIAFCRWLTAKAWEHPDFLPAGLDHASRWRITLPTEWQWEKAARGHAGRQYPWGAEYTPGYANVDETNGQQVGPHYLYKTSAVGMYPQGASPYDVLDMSGNVWEWCLNEYDQPKSFLETGSANRVLRGGSWNLSLERASALARHWSWNLSRDLNLGFRVVVAGASPSTLLSDAPDSGL